MSDGLMVWLALIVLSVGFWGFVVFGRPAVASARLQAEASDLHDRIMDQVLCGGLSQRDPTVGRLLRLANLACERPEAFGWSEALAVKSVLKSRGKQLSEVSNYAASVPAVSVDPTVASAVHSYEQELGNSLRNYMVDSSSLWWFLRPAGAWHRRFHVSQGLVPSAISPDQLVPDMASLTMMSAFTMTRGRGATLEDFDLTAN